MKRIQIYITEEQYSTLKKLASETGTTLSEVVRQAVDEYFQDRDVKADTLLKIIGMGVSGDSDASLNIDKVLYNGK